MLKCLYVAEGGSETEQYLDSWDALQPWGTLFASQTLEITTNAL